MNSRKFIASLVCCALVSLFALGICSPRGVAGQLVSGVYKITQTTDLGTEVRVTMQIRLMNASDDRMFVTQVRLREFLRWGRDNRNDEGCDDQPTPEMRHDETHPPLHC